MQIDELKKIISDIKNDYSVIVFNKATRSLIPVQKTYINEPFEMLTIEINHQHTDTVYFDDTTEKETIEIFQKLKDMNLVTVKEIIEESGMTKDTVYNFFDTERKTTPTAQTIQRISGAISSILIRKKKNISNFFEDFSKNYEKFS